MIVIDATVLADYFIGEEAVHRPAKQLLTEDPVWISPALWQYELGNVLRTYVKAGRLAAAAAETHLRNAGSLVVETVDMADPQGVLALALERGLTMYDASYVWLAKLRSLTLRTRDADVLKFCPEYSAPMPVAMP